MVKSAEFAVPSLRRVLTVSFRRLLLAAVVAAVSGCATAPQAQPPAPQAAGPAFTIASFNVRCRTGKDTGELRWYRRLPRVAEVIRSRGFDLVGVQE